MASKVSGVIEKIQTGGSNGTTYAIASTAYGYCETAADTAAKTIEMTGFKLEEGVTVHIKFKNGNTATSPTLNIEGTGAKEIRQYGTNLVNSTTSVNGWQAGTVISLTYDGVYWIKETTGDHTHSTQSLSRPTQLNGVNDVTYQALINDVRANRLAFLPADQIIIEKTIDGGASWQSAGISDNVKTALFSETRPTVQIPQINGQMNTLCGLRITITGMKYNVPEGTAETEKYNYWNSTYVKSTERYNQIKNLYFWVSTARNALKVIVQRATGGSPNNWNTVFNNDNYGMTGWSGNDIISFGQGVFGGSTTQTSNFWNWRIILMTCGPNGASILNENSLTSIQSVSEIRGYGDTWWTAGNKYAASDHLYSWDYNKNATFPANLTATKFIGSLQGNADTATTASKLTTSNLGSNIKPIYLVAGVATECKTYAGGTKVTLNASDKGENDASFYAPTSSGAAGNVLISAGNSAPNWYTGLSLTGSGTANDPYSATFSNSVTVNNKLYIGSNTSYGDAYTPIYWNNGIPAAVTSIQKVAFTINNGKSGVQLSNTAFTADSYVTEIVVESGISYLKGSLSWTSDSGKITLTSSTTTGGAVSGYIVVSRGGNITPTSTQVS